jgi:Ni/Co efflux regulator RcnB
MKTLIKKILLIAAAMVFFSAGVSFAQDRNPGHGYNNSRGHAPGQFHKTPAYRAAKPRTNYYAYRNPGYAAGHYYRGRYYPKKNYTDHNYYRHYNRYPSHDTFFFGFSVR